MLEWRALRHRTPRYDHSHMANVRLHEEDTDSARSLAPRRQHALFLVLFSAEDDVIIGRRNHVAAVKKPVPIFIAPGYIIALRRLD